jgi:hypothetical protein
LGHEVSNVVKKESFASTFTVTVKLLLDTCHTNEISPLALSGGLPPVMTSEADPAVNVTTNWVVTGTFVLVFASNTVVEA